MTRLALCLALAVLTVAYGTALAGSDKTAGQTDGVVVKVLEAFKGGGSVLHVGPAAGGGASEDAVDIVIPSKSKSDPALMDLLRNADPGTLLDIQTNVVSGQRVLVSATGYDARPGEDEPNVYPISKRTTYRLLGTAVPAIEVTKFKKSTLLVLPVTSRDGSVTPDADMLRTFKTLKDTDSVVAMMETQPIKPGVFSLTSLKVYVPWERATYSKLTSKTYQGNEYTALVVKTDDGDALPLLMSAKDEKTLTNALGNIRPHHDLFYRTKTVDNVTWVTDVKPVSQKSETAVSGGSGEGTGTGTTSGSDTGSGIGQLQTAQAWRIADLHANPQNWQLTSSIPNPKGGFDNTYRQVRTGVVIHIHVNRTNTYVGNGPRL
jgi:hypothetical protein